ncbi:fatty acyl-CoA reductase 1-like isoform X2 [Nylanderia fulva]|uniref:fatty acyl-CoA reductase 1-like isoform X2 n=1 Tax=Nylanderia fulva TaxID=613905 RepID=UPI0010FB352D|nr:fatty acyl-CoA reductase 1-like isoform X2 [Nylanderia fulva]
MDENINNPIKSITSFYAGQSIFLTGATGFMGKVCMEKILRSCPDVREVFILMRPKKEQSINERLEQILKLPLFDKLRKEQPSNLKKIIPLFGDVSKENLGLSAADREMLVERVTIIIHAAASVRFNDSLKYAIFINTRSTRDICILAQDMKNLLALVYVSTAYAHINNSVIEEKIYPPVADWRKMIKAAESLDEHILNVFTAKCLECFPNTYIFSKNLAESVIADYSSSLPCAIVRPSIVSNTLNDPFPGWIDNLNGIVGILVGGGKGVLRVFKTNKHLRPDVMPVDVAIKWLIITVWKIGLTSFKPGSSPFIINCTSSNLRGLSIEPICKMGFQLLDEIPFEQTLWTPGVIITNNSIIYYILTMLLHILPAILIDLILKLTKHKPINVYIEDDVKSLDIYFTK